jgi:hypothetical protein
MANTTFSGPVTSDNGFVGATAGTHTGPVAATTMTSSGAATMDAADFTFTSLPTSDPGVSGRLWVDTESFNVLKVSTGA